MNDTIIAALISAGASVLVGLLGSQSGHHRARSPVARDRRSVHLWYAAMAMLAVWQLASPAWHHDWGGMNFIAVPIAMGALALVVPIRPLTAVWMTLALASTNFVLGPLGNRLVGSSSDTRFGLPAEKLVVVFGISLVGAAVIGAICLLRERFAARGSGATQSVTEPGPDLVADLATLASLRNNGTLSEAEFRAAKQQLLDRS